MEGERVQQLDGRVGGVHRVERQGHFPAIRNVGRVPGCPG